MPDDQTTEQDNLGPIFDAMLGVMAAAQSLVVAPGSKHAYCKCFDCRRVRSALAKVIRLTGETKECPHGT